MPNESQPKERRLEWEFVPLACESLGAPSKTTLKVVEELAKRVAFRSGCSYGHVKQRLLQRLSYAIWSCNAAAILGHVPQCVEDVEQPLQM